MNARQVAILVPRCDFFEAGTCDNPEKVFWEQCNIDSGHSLRCARWREINWDQYKPDIEPRERN